MKKLFIFIRIEDIYCKSYRLMQMKWKERICFQLFKEMLCNIQEPMTSLSLGVCKKYPLLLMQHKIRRIMYIPGDEIS